MYDAAVFMVLSFSFMHDIEERRLEAHFPWLVGGGGGGGDGNTDSNSELDKKCGRNFGNG
jgi:hypothetical protein